MAGVMIITGIGGHLGNTLARLALQKEYHVRGLALPQEDASMLYGKGVQIVRGNVCDRASLEPLFMGLENCGDVTVIHTAGIVSVKTKYDPAIDRVNVDGTRNVVDLCRAHRVKKLVYISSVHAIPEAPDGQTQHEVASFDRDGVEGYYAKSKAAASQIVLDAAKEGLNATIVQPSGIIGPNDYGKGPLTQMILSYLNGSLTACVNGGFDFVDVRDVARGALAAAEKGRSGECYILSNRYYNVTDLLERLHEITGKEPVRTVLPMWFAKMTAPLAEFYYRVRRESPLFTRYSLHTLTSNARFTYEKARRELGYLPRDISDTLKDTVAFLREQGRVRLPKRRVN